MYLVDAGKFNKRISFLFTNDDAENEMGATEPKLEIYKTVWASIRPYRGKDYIETDRTKTEIPYRIQIRYRSGITTDMLIKFQEKIYEIRSINNIEERNVLLEIIAVEKKVGV